MEIGERGGEVIGIAPEKESDMKGTKEDCPLSHVVLW